MRRILLATLLGSVLFFSLAGGFVLVTYGNCEISREAVMEMAEAYKNHRWIATEANIHHDSPGPQPRGSEDWVTTPEPELQLRRMDGPVDTPDRNTYPNWPEWKGWAVGENIGVPYKWLGWSSIEEFDQDIAEGKYAGDINMEEGSENAVGVDCAGFVSRCWRLPYDHTTRMLRSVSQPIKFEQLEKGDILNNYGYHVVMFKEFLTAEKDTSNVTRIKVIEATGIDWKVNEWEYLLVGIQETEETWHGQRYATDRVQLQRVSDPSMVQTTAPYVPRTRSTLILFLTRSLRWFGIFLTISVITGPTAAYFLGDAEKKGHQRPPIPCENT